MANEPRKILIFITFILAFRLDRSEAEVYQVGGITGWTSIGEVNYKTWASTKHFTVGDVIVFEYNKRFHNVAAVSHQDFKACKSDKAYETFTSGNDSIVLKHPGHFYFICGVSIHCKEGQKVDIRVPEKDAAGAGAPPPATISVADPPATTDPPPHESQPPEEIHHHPPPPHHAPPPATSHTASDSTSFVYYFKCCVVLFLLVSYYLED